MQSPSGCTVRERLDALRSRIEQASARACRRPEDISLVAVTKTVSVPRIQEAVEAGISVLGENRVQEAETKVGLVRGNPAWHMVGHLQRNKVKKAVALFDMIQSVDSLDLAREIDRRAGEAAKVMDVLVEVHTASEQTKSGVPPEDALDLVARMSHLRHISVKGLMTVGTFTDDEAGARGCFRNLRELARSISESGIANVGMQYLSMGMTADFEIAIEEGANMIRIGTAIFGARQA